MDQISKSEDSGIYDCAYMNQTGKDSKHKKKLSQQFKDLLEEQQTIKTKMDESSSHSTSEPLLHIKANICNNHVLLGIHCERQIGALAKMVAEIEKLNLSVVNSSVTPLGSSTLNITVVAQVEEEFDMAEEDIVRELHSSFCQFI